VDPSEGYPHRAVRHEVHPTGFERVAHHLETI